MFTALFLYSKNILGYPSVEDIVIQILLIVIINYVNDYLTLKAKSHILMNIIVSNVIFCGIIWVVIEIFGIKFTPVCLWNN
jgi:hypothetical protein